MDIVLLILKIIGIIILVLLAVLLSLILAVLLVPVRYLINGTWGEELKLYARVSWFLHFIHVFFSWDKKKAHIRVRILGMPLYDSERAPKKKLVRRKKTPTVDENKESNFHRDRNNQKTSGELDNIDKLTKEEEIKSSDEQIFEAIEQNSIKEVSEPKSIDDNIQVKVEKETVFQKISSKIKNVINKIKSFFRKIMDKIRAIFESIAEIKRKGGLILDFIRDEINKEGFHLTYGSIRKFLKHILPRKLKANIIYGTGDPCSTGQILGALSILYSIYGDKLTIIPDFENQRFEGNAMARGRIRLVTILIIVIKLILDKRFRQLRNNVRLLKEAL